MLQCDRLIKLRKEKKLIQQDMADLLKITRTAYNKYENGKSQPPSDTIVILADYFGISTDYLLGKTDEPNPPDIKKEAPSELDSKEAFRQALIKEGVIPADRPLTDEERDKLAALADAFLNGGRR